VVSSAASRRFVLLPLLALALLGPASDRGTTPSAEPTTSTTPTPSTPDGAAGAALIDALEAEQVFYVDHLVFASGTGGELQTLQELDPSIAWGRTVIVQAPATEGEDSPIVVLRAPLPGGASLCLALVTTERDAGLWYARVSMGKCPRARAGMRGWSGDESVWGI
jgi:hypothetical protein